MTNHTSSPLRFGLFEFDRHSGELRRRGLAVRLTPHARALLGILLEAPIRTRTREEIQQRLWSANTFVDFESGVNKIVHSLREALGETATKPHFIETVASGGYRFLPQFVERSLVTNEPRTPSGVARLAVLPIAAEPETELISLSKRITSCLIEELSQKRGVRVMAESTVKSHNLEGCSPQQAGESLGVQAVLSGELTRHDSELLLRMELIDVADGALLRGAHVEGVLQPAARCEGELARKILEQIPIQWNAPARFRKMPEPELVPVHRANAS